ncbi:MAG: hypothetical protein J7L89_05545 [Bacteroidales bacterium]|nr:hypothetical protein [Bacteroidales bacterium]
MKLFYSFIRPLFAATIFLLIVSPGCRKFEDGLNNLTWSLNFNLVSTTWDIQFVDAQTGDLIGGLDTNRVEVSITGPDETYLIDLAGKKHNFFYSTYGFLSLALHPDRRDPDRENPVRFMLHVRYPGYLPVSLPVITYTTGIHPVKVQLVNLSTAVPPVGILNQQNLTQVVNGQTGDSLELFTPLNQASLSIPKDTRLTTLHGAELGGSLSVTLGYFTGGNEVAVKSLPGGQMAVKTNQSYGQIYPAAALYIGLSDEYNKEAAFFDQPLHTTLLIDNRVYHPDDGSRISPADSLDVWYQDTETGTWRILQTIHLEAFQNKILAHFPVNRTGLFMLGWIDDILCKEPLSIHFNTLPEYRTLPYVFQASVYEVISDEVRFIRQITVGNPIGQDARLNNLPGNRELIIRWNDYLNGPNAYYRAPDPLLYSNYCSSSAVDLDLLPKTTSSLKEVHVIFIDTQHNNSRYIPQVFPGYYRQLGSTWQSAFVYQGVAYLVNAREGATYELGINFKGEFHRKEVVIGSGEVMEIEIEID